MDSPTGYDDATLKRLADEVGVFGMAVPERFGGAGFGLVELGLVFHEAGRALLCAPLLSSALSAALLNVAADDQTCDRLLPQIAAGTARVAAAVVEDDRGWDAVPSVHTTGDGSGWTLTGTKTWVLDGVGADEFVVSAAVEGVSSLFLVSASDVVVSALSTVDLSRRVASVTLDAAPGRLLGPGADALAHVGDLARSLLAAEQTGIAQRCLETSTAWALEREQFGRAIGSFQSIKHKLADVQLEVEAAVSASMFALWAADNAPAELPTVARIAAFTCSETAMLACEENIQVHGGIGATWEHPAHLYLRRATTNRVLFGDEQQHLEVLASHFA